MRNPATADEKERRFVEYIQTLNKGQLAEFKLQRTGKIANFRHQLMELLNEMIEARAEDLAAGMMMEYAPERPAKKPKAVVHRLPMLKRKRPVWLKNETHTKAVS